jgi:hypothetical protein
MRGDGREKLQIPARMYEQGTGSPLVHSSCSSRELVARRLDSRIIVLMNWQTPAYEELKMDAEIGSYQEDGERPPIAERRAPKSDASDGE